MKYRTTTYRILSRLRLSLAVTAAAIVCLAAQADVTSLSASSQIDSLLDRGIELTASTAYAAALECNLQALDLMKRTGQTEKLPAVYMHIGNIFSHINDLQTARTYYLRALPLARSRSDGRTSAGLLINMFYISFLQGEPDSAAYYLDRLERLVQSTPQARCGLIFNHGMLHELRGRPDSALACYHRAAYLSKGNGRSRLDEAAAYSAIADLYMNLQLPDSAMKYYQLNEHMAREDGRLDLLLESLHHMAEVYDIKGNREMALNCKEEYLTLSDSILSRDEICKIKNTQSTYELEGNAHTIRSLNITNTLQRNWIMSLIVFIAVVLAFAVAIWLQKRRLSRAYADLYLHNKEELDAEIRYRERIAELEKRLKDAEVKEAKEDAVAQEMKDSESERRLLQTKEQRSRLMERIRQEFENSEDYCRTDYSIDALASAVESNARYVSEAINEEYGMNFRALLNEFRIRRSMQMLSDEEHYGHMTIKAISEKVGYRSHSTFISVFVRQTGLKPSLYQSLSRTHRE